MSAVSAGDGADLAVHEQAGDGGVGKDFFEYRNVLVAGAVEGTASLATGEEKGREGFAGLRLETLAFPAEGSLSRDRVS
mgnify:CR=1 FL=1